MQFRHQRPCTFPSSLRGAPESLTLIPKVRCWVIWVLSESLRHLLRPWRGQLALLSVTEAIEEKYVTMLSLKQVIYALYLGVSKVLRVVEGCSSISSDVVGPVDNACSAWYDEIGVKIWMLLFIGWG